MLDLWGRIASEVQSITIRDNLGLESLSGLENLQIANDGSLIIEGSDLLTDLDALNRNLPEILGAFKVSPRFPTCTDICNLSIPPVYQPFIALSFLSTINDFFP